MSNPLLHKTKGSRFNEVETYKCMANKLEGFLTLKSVHHDEEFVHVILSKLENLDTEVVVKIHEANQAFVSRELQALKRLSGWSNVAQYLCDFKCTDDVAKWLKEWNTSTRFCSNNGNTIIHLIVMEYIQEGDLATYISSITSKKKLQSLFTQTALAIAELAYTYKISHGDLNSGNILIARATSKHHTYHVDGTDYAVKTYGVLPKFVDFGRGHVYRTRPSSSFIKDDIITMLSVMTTWIKDETLRSRCKKIINDVSLDSKIKLKHIFEYKWF